MTRKIFLSLTIATLIFSLEIKEAKAQDSQKFEVGGQFSLLRVSSLSGTTTSIQCVAVPCSLPPTFTRNRRTEPGFGGRLGYNISRRITLEAEGNLFPRDRGFEGGRKSQGLFGVKAGQHFEKVGLFAKARPGFMRFSNGDLRSRSDTICPAIFPPPVGCFEATARTFFAVDVGGVVEVYPSKRTIVRFDAGDTIVKLGERNVVAVVSPPPGVLAPTRLVVVRAPSETTHNLQGSVGVGFRF
jgi:hypothetical protein